MATYYGNSNPPKKNQAFAMQICLQDMANSGSFKANPTLAANDVKVSGASNGGNPSAMGNIATLPSVDPTGSIWVNLALTAGEMDFDQVFVQFIDQTSPKEWADLALCIETTA